MAKVKTQSPLKMFLVVSALATGSVLGLVALGSNTNYQQQASDADLNTSSSIAETANLDGTMGPETSLDNVSNQLPIDAVGELSVEIVTSPSEDISSSVNLHNKPEKMKKGSQKLTSLVLNITKMEVHLAKVCKDDPVIVDVVGSASASTADDTNLERENGRWETVQLDETMTSLDLVQLAKTGDAVSLGLTKLACGKYTQVRLYVSSATAMFENSTTTVPVSLHGNSGIVKIVRPFEIVPGQTTTIKLDINPERSLVKAGSNYYLKPVVARFLSDK